MRSCCPSCQLARLQWSTQRLWPSGCQGAALLSSFVRCTALQCGQSLCGCCCCCCWILQLLGSLCLSLFCEILPAAYWIVLTTSSSSQRRISLLRRLKQRLCMVQVWQDALPGSRNLPQKLLGICRVPLDSSNVPAQGEGASQHCCMCSSLLSNRTERRQCSLCSS